MICDELPTPDLAALVGTCCHTYHRTIHRFAQRYAEVYFDFSEHGLNHLHAIAQNPVMCQYVQRLVVMAPEPHLGRSIQWQWSVAGHLRSPLDMPIIRRFRDDLVHRLPHCRSFIISPIACCDQSREETSNDQQLKPDDVATILYDVMADACLPVKLLWYGKGVNYTAETMSANRLPKCLFGKPGFRAAWGQLENLHLEHDLTPYNYSFILDSICHASSLRKLYLSLGPRDLAMEFFAQLSRSETLPSTLERITLAFTAIQADGLIRILYKSRLSLRRIGLTGVTGLSPGWLAVLGSMQSQFPQLETIELDMLYGCGGVTLSTLSTTVQCNSGKTFELQTGGRTCSQTMGIGLEDLGALPSNEAGSTALDMLLKAQSPGVAV
ncbi:uncharacterized protein LDX57_012726 [Aspergillus melleus]|uniref:uncharacterized protein n=1 Tax=Aspergillus melleus TaxID=138277 RepID=UPI001E8DF272|nr:uncharacterized protein LDX57_012726 [Aspergillus melleus]KAH8435097.1 hypothetical protein LDX57_012726 [Aspergillus melleus]